MNAQKRMGKKGTLTIPQHLRHRLGFQGGTALDITATEDGGLLLQKHRATYNICGGTYEVVNFKGFDICRECFLGVGEGVERVHGWNGTGQPGHPQDPGGVPGRADQGVCG